ncbi:MAG: transporter substrate-binding domain-containing protein, partial [Bacteroidales bacterium]|nr:transporter substrate-binding domain-containing protein [Bacteroidales bacterium]
MKQHQLKMKHTIAVVVFIILILSYFKSGLCGSLQPENTTKKKLIVKGDQYYPPFEFLNEKGEPDGFNVALFKIIAADLQLDY